MRQVEAGSTIPEVRETKKNEPEVHNLLGLTISFGKACEQAFERRGSPIADGRNQRSELARIEPLVIQEKSAALFQQGLTLDKRPCIERGRTALCEHDEGRINITGLYIKLSQWSSDRRHFRPCLYLLGCHKYI